MRPLPSLRQLRYLAALAEHGNFGRAAAACAVTQSSLSAGIQELESVLGGVSLVERSKRHVLITPLGKEVLERGCAILRQAEDLAETVQAAGQPLAGPLQLGIIPTIGPYLLPRILPPLQASFPRLLLYIREEPTALLVDRLVAGRLDVLVAAMPYEFPDAVETLAIAEDRIMVACPAGHRLAAVLQVDHDALASEPLLLLEDGHCLRRHALAACHLAGAGHNEVFQGTSIPTLLQMVAAGLGITLIPELAVPWEIGLGNKSVVARPLADGSHARSIVLAWRRASARTREFAELARVIGTTLAIAQS